MNLAPKVRDNLGNYLEQKPLLDELSALFEGQGNESDELEPSAA